MIDIRVNVKPTVKALGDLAKQVPFAVSVALNRTAEDALAALRREIPQRFIVRNARLLRFVAPPFLPIENRARKDRLVARLETEGIGRILNPFETGIPKVGTPLLPVAIPTPHLQFTKRTVVPRRWYPVNLGLVPRRDASGRGFFALGKNAIRDKKSPFKTTKRGAVQIKGKLRTFVLDPQHHRGISPKQRGVYVRIGKDRDDIRMIWMYRDRTRRPRILRFRETVEAEVRRRWPENFRGAWAFALRTAR